MWKIELKKKMKKIHWEKFFTRKMVAIAAVVVVMHFVDVWWHFHLAGKSGEMLLGATLEHICFGVPVLED